MLLSSLLDPELLVYTEMKRLMNQDDATQPAAVFEIETNGTGAFAVGSPVCDGANQPVAMLDNVFQPGGDGANQPVAMLDNVFQPGGDGANQPVVLVVFPHEATVLISLSASEMHRPVCRIYK